MASKPQLIFERRLRVEQAAQLCGVAHGVIRQWINLGISDRFGGCIKLAPVERPNSRIILIPESSLEAFLRNFRGETAL